jgi:hypothetical protein
MGHKSMRSPAPPPREPAEVTVSEQAAFPHHGAAFSSNQDLATDKQPWNPAAVGYEFFTSSPGCVRVPSLYIYSLNGKKLYVVEGKERR